MFRSLHMKLVLILILLIISVMVVMGTFLINSVGNYYLRDFYDRVTGLFDYNMRVSLSEAAQSEDGDQRLAEMIAAHAGSLGIDSHCNYYILDGEGNYLSGPRAPGSADITPTPNLLAAMAGKVGITNAVIDSYMDAAYPVDGGEQDYIIYIKDDKQEIQTLSWRFFSIVIETMLFGLLVAVLLSFLLSKTITTPVENMKKQARLVAAGDFSHRLPIQSGDEIGDLTETFNYMAEVLQNTLGEVQEERDKLNTLFLYMTDGVAAFTPAGRIIHMNPATERLMGVTFDENMTFNEVFTGMAMPSIARVGERKSVSSEISRMGRTLNVLFAPYGAVDDERGVIAVIHDVTEQRKLDDARREFVANVSHELRTPLTNIKSYTETLMDTAGELPAETEKRFLGVITNEADRMTRIVKDLLTLSKLDCGRMDLTFSRFSIRNMLESVYTAMKLDAEKNGHALSLAFEGDMPEMVGDRERLEQVVVNIISNAIKYTAAGGHIEVCASRRDERNVMIRIRDNGIGIPESDVPRLFERFYRVDKARSREKGGTGLGLAIAKEMVEAHHGTIHLESTLHVGTTVTIVLPTDLHLEEA
ncbi:MAG: HAMP domain-containing protein [Butyricicoccus pullicaecorum]|jgi:two-component system sensor histidine kinase VicK|nr:HAMP domain-containing protein [Butyricicoccus pullicaecorum]